VENWERLALCKDYQTKGNGMKAKSIMDFLKNLFIAVSQLFQKYAIFGYFQLCKFFKDLYLAKFVTYTLLVWLKRIAVLYGIDWHLFGIHTTCHPKVMVCFVLTCKMKQNGY